jgi:hypothetical protein
VPLCNGDIIRAPAGRENKQNEKNEIANRQTHNLADRRACKILVPHCGVPQGLEDGEKLGGIMYLLPRGCWGVDLFHFSGLSRNS